MTGDNINKYVNFFSDKRIYNIKKYFNYKIKQKKTTTTIALKNAFKSSPKSEGNTCIAEPNLLKYYPQNNSVKDQFSFFC